MVKYMNELKIYNSKRNFNKTKEPKGKVNKTNKKKFCLQHHLATHDHYDLRLEHNGVLVSFAIPKGPSYNPNEKRLAIKVEDHPLSYRNFEGNIPPKEYGAGIVMLFDEGTYKEIEFNEKLIKVIFNGERLRGMWTLTKFKDNNYLLIKDKDFYENYIDLKQYERSIKTGRTMNEIKKSQRNSTITISNPKKKIINNINKEEIFNYYQDIYKHMYPYITNCFISVKRAPNGINNDIFFKKHLENTNNYLKRKFLKKNYYYYILDKLSLLSEVQMNSYEFHLWGSNATTYLKPNIMVFDLDPDEKISIKKLREGVKDLKNILDKLNLKSYLKTSGNKGYHILVPLKKEMTWKKFSKVAENIALLMEKTWPSKYTTNNRIQARKNKIFIDYLRNTYTATFVAPYSIRLKPNAPISMPISWNDLDKIKPNEITIKNYKKYLKKKDPWQDFFDLS